jgi:hypothetical protein
MITDAGLDSIAAVRRDDIEDYKVWLAAQLPAGGGTITAETHRQRARPRARRAAYTRRQAGLECTCGPWRSFIDSEPGPREVPAAMSVGAGDLPALFRRQQVQRLALPVDQDGAHRGGRFWR